MPPETSQRSPFRKPSLGVGCGVSLLAHLGLMILLAIASPAVVMPRAERSDDPAGSIVLISPVHAAAPAAEPAPSAPDAKEAVAAASPAKAPTTAMVRRVPIRPRKPRPAATEADRVPATGADTDPPATEPDEDVPATSPTSLTSTTSLAPAAPPTPAASPAQTTPAVVSVAVASSLRVEDEFPSWPEGLSRRHFPRSVSLEVCVSEMGAVRDVRITSPAEDLLRETLQRSVRRWRYRALVMDGRPRAFCHPVRIEYRRG